MRLTFLLWLCISWCISTNSQVVKIPDKAKNHFQSQYKNASDIKWSNDVTNYKCRFKEDGVAYTAHYSIDGDWSFTEKWIAESAIPAETRNTFSKSKYRDWDKKGVAYVVNNKDEKYYRYEVKKGIKTVYVFIDKDGKVIKENTTI